MPLYLGKVIVVTNEIGNSKAIVHDKNGLLAPMQDENSLFDTMLYLVWRGVEGRNMSLMAKNIMNEQFEIKSQMVKITQLLV